MGKGVMEEEAWAIVETMWMGYRGQSPCVLSLPVLTKELLVPFLLECDYWPYSHSCRAGLGEDEKKPAPLLRIPVII